MKAKHFIFNEEYIREKLELLDSRKRLSFKEERFIQSAINFLILPHKNEPYDLVLIKRVNNNKDKHSGEMAFPGGKRDYEDENVLVTALRETEEEINVPRSRIHVLGSFDDFVTPSRYIITPIVSYIEETQIMKKNEEEVSEILTIPITFFANKKNYQERTYNLHDDIIAVGRYHYKTTSNKKYIIYGATCHMIVHFIDLVYQLGLKASRVRRLIPEDLISDEFLSQYRQEKHKYQNKY